MNIVFGAILALSACEGDRIPRLNLDMDDFTNGVSNVVLPAIKRPKPNVARGLIGSIEGPIHVAFSKGKKPDCQLECRLIVLTRIDDSRVSADFNGMPQTLDEAIESALRACEVLGLDGEGVKQWKAKGPDGDDPLMLTKASEMQRMHLQLRRSFDDTRPWRIIVTVSGPFPRRSVPR